ncbi:hypothetical protein BKA69DRAFT_880188 [Paraphysoderma sedebokerense]|nr:hypothetical protein BKA69DRAFT_880188 [Paraphysoderma sedebokerense]
MLSSIPADNVDATTSSTEPSDSTQSQHGPRFQKLQLSFNTALEKTLSTCSYEKLVSAFPQLSQDQPDALKSAHEQFIGFLRNSAMEEFKTILEKKKFPEKLDELDNLIDDAKKNNQVFDNTDAENINKLFITPEQSLLSRSIPMKQKEVERLKAEIAKMESQNKDLSASLIQNKKQVDELTQMVAGVIGNVEKTITMLSSVPVEEMKKQVKEIVE